MRQRRRLVLIAAAFVAVLAAGCGSTTAAVTVDGQSTSRSDFEDQLDEIYENDGLRGLLFQQVDPEQLRAPGGMVGGYSQAYVGDMVSLQVQFAVAEDMLEDEGVELTDEDREATEDAIAGEVDGAFDGLSASTKRFYLDGFAAFDLLRAELGDEFEPVVVAAIQDADVTVSSRYGTWNAEEISVDPPTSPRPAPGTDEPTGLDASELSAG